MTKYFEVLQREALDDPFITILPSAATEAEPPVDSPANAPDEIGNLVQRLFFKGGVAAGPRVVSFSGIAQEFRSSWICARAGQVLAAQANASVCLVDANFHSPHLHIHFSAVNRSGLSSALTNEGPIRSFSINLLRPNLSLMPAGSVAVDVRAHAERCRSRFTELRNEFDYVLVSAPSLTREPEATLLAQLADGMVLIVEANQTRRESVRRVKDRLESAQVQLLGAVLDQRTFPIPESLYRKL